MAFLLLNSIGVLVWFYPARSTNFSQLALAFASVRSVGGSGNQVSTECSVRLHNKLNSPLRINSLDLYFTDQQGHQCGVWNGFARDIVLPAHGGLDLKYQTPLPPDVSNSTVWVQAEVSIELRRGNRSHLEHHRLGRVART